MVVPALNLSATPAHPSELNDTRVRQLPAGMFDVNYHIPLLVIASLVIMANVLVIVLFLTRENLRKAGRLLLFSLALSDLSTGLILIPLNIGCEVTYSLPLCVSSGMLNRFIAISTIYHILAITFETYYAILLPMQHRVNVEPCKVLGIALVIWLVSLFTALTPLYWISGAMKDVRSMPTADFMQKQTIYEIVVFAVGFLMPLTLMVFAHARMFSTILNALKLLRKRSSSARPPSNTSKFKTALLFAVILLVFTISWSFWFVAGMLKAVVKRKHPLPLWAQDSLTIFRYSTSFVNPLLYTFFRPDVYKAFKSSFTKAKLQKRSTSFSNHHSGTGKTKRSFETNSTSVKDASVATTLRVNCPRAVKYDTRV